MDTRRIEMDKLFRECMDDAVEQADRIMEIRGKQYNDGGIKIFDYAPFFEVSFMHEVWKNTLRLKSMVGQPNFGDDGINPDDFLGKIVDTINYLRMLYAIHILVMRGYFKEGEDNADS